MENRKSVEALHIDREGSGMRTQWTAREFPLTIMLNGEQLVTVLCSPGDLDALSVGFLFSEGIIKGKEEITGLALDDELGIIRIRTATDKTADGKLFMKRVPAAEEGWLFTATPTWIARRKSGRICG
jgi:formate dehydrogenase accessory protein FdhD